jgi:hypothetical protein
MFADRQARSAACTCVEHEACSDPACRGPYYTEVEFWTRTAVPSDAELRKGMVRDADS